MAIPIAQIKAGMVIVIQSRPFFVLSSEHVKLGRGRGIQRVRLKSFSDGSVKQETFRGNESADLGSIETKTAQYLYADPQNAHFMADDFEQFEVPRKIIQEKLQFLKEGERYKLSYFRGEPFGVELPIKLTLTVKETDPGLRGDRASAGTKPAKLETGATIQVPLHIKIGDRLVVDTRDGSYVERAKS